MSIVYVDRKEFVWLASEEALFNVIYLNRNNTPTYCGGQILYGCCSSCLLHLFLKKIHFECKKKKSALQQHGLCLISKVCCFVYVAWLQLVFDQPLKLKHDHIVTIFQSCVFFFLTSLYHTTPSLWLHIYTNVAASST